MVKKLFSIILFAQPFSALSMTEAPGPTQTFEAAKNKQKVYACAITDLLFCEQNPTTVGALKLMFNTEYPKLAAGYYTLQKKENAHSNQSIKQYRNFLSYGLFATMTSIMTWYSVQSPSDATSQETTLNSNTTIAILGSSIALASGAFSMVNLKAFLENKLQQKKCLFSKELSKSTCSALLRSKIILSSNRTVSLEDALELSDDTSITYLPYGRTHKIITRRNSL